MITAIVLIFIFGILLLIIGAAVPEAAAKNAENIAENAADKTIDEINSFSESVFAELEEKYNELLFLYRMIDEKKNEAALKKPETKIQQEQPQPDDLDEIAQALKNKLSESLKNNYSNSKLEDIKRLYDDGFSVHEIAQKLSMGHREVELIMKLGRLI